MGRPKGATSVQSRSLYTRASYLYQAAALLTTQASSSKADGSDDSKKSSASASTAESYGPPTQPLARRLLSDLRWVCLKAQLRAAPQMKRTICKGCDSLLVEGETCTSTTENRSKGGRKPWADVLVCRCHTCGYVKRFPVDPKRQKRRHLRAEDPKATEATAHLEGEKATTK